MADLALNLALFKAFEADIGLAGYAIEGGRPVTGVPPTENDITGGGFWKVTYSKFVLGSPDQHREWFKVLAHIARAGNRLIVPLRTEITMPPSLNVEFNAAYVEFNATINLKVNTGTLQPGTVFSVDHTTKKHRSYIISTIDAVAGSVYTVGITPPLRENTAIAKACDFYRPKVMMRRAPGFTPSWQPYGKFTAEQHLDLVEAGW